MRKMIAFVGFIIVFAFLFLTALELRPFGEPEKNDVGATPMDDHFIANGQNETGSNNIVTSIVFDYRGFDTLGEATVLFTAVTGIFVLFGRRVKK